MCGLLVAAVFGIAALPKLTQPAGFRAELADYELLPSWLLGPGAIVIPLLELTGAALAVVSSTHYAGTALLIGLLAVFTTAVIRNLTKGNRGISCACFGRASQELNWSIPVRNSFLLIGAFVSLAAAPTPITASAIVLVGLVALFAWLAIEAVRLFDSLSETPG